MGDIILTMKGIDKSFPGVHALDHVDLEVRKGEVLALMGENGAGKSTLMKVLTGIYKKDSGTLHMKEKKLNSKIQEKRRCRYCDRASGAEHAWSFNSGTELIYRS